MRRAAKIALGCLFAPVGLFVLGLIAFGALRASGVPEPQVESERIAQEVPEAPRAPAASSTELRAERRPETRAEISRQIAEDALRVELDLVEGYFRIEPHDGPGIEVEAQYDKASYRLDRSYGLEGDTPVFRLKFASKVHWLRRVVQDGGIDDSDFGENEILILLPRGVPIALNAKISRAEAEFVLDGLSLIDLVTDLSMGEYTLETDEPNPLAMPRAVFDVGMGEVELKGLSHLNAARIELAGGMGEVTVDMGASLMGDTIVEARMRMGEMRLMLPDDALYDADSDFTAFLGEVDDAGVRGRRIDDPETAHTLSVRGSVMMGELRVEEFRARRRPVIDQR